MTARFSECANINHLCYLMCTVEGSMCTVEGSSHTSSRSMQQKVAVTAVLVVVIFTFTSGAFCFSLPAVPVVLVGSNGYDHGEW